MGYDGLFKKDGPFAYSVQEYRDSGWDVLPLPERAKKSPPEGFTGRKNSDCYPTDEDVEAWLQDPRWEQGNVCVRVGRAFTRTVERSDSSGCVDCSGKVGGAEEAQYELVGIDVDAYQAKGFDVDGADGSSGEVKAKQKNGAEHLAWLEEQHGILPNTFISTSRVWQGDGVSGIRWFAVPAGLEFMGKPRIVTKETGADGEVREVEKSSDSIEIVQKVHRYGVVWPSIHPETGFQYLWFEGEAELEMGADAGREDSPLDMALAAMDGPPNVQDVPLLPDKWVDALTNGRLAFAGKRAYDESSSVSEIDTWADEALGGNYEELAGFMGGGEGSSSGSGADGAGGMVGEAGMCQHMKHMMAKALAKIADATDHHNGLVAMHHNMYRLAAEGHLGWKYAVGELEAAWMDKVIEDQARSNLHEAREEIMRSRFGALRLLKGAVDEGSVVVTDSDPCRKSKGTGPDRKAKPHLKVVKGDGASGNSEVSGSAGREAGGGGSGGGGTVGGEEAGTGSVGGGAAGNDGAGPFGGAPAVTDEFIERGYLRNEQSNAQHLHDMYGDVLKFVPNHPDNGKSGAWLKFDETVGRWRADFAEVGIYSLFKEVAETRRQYGLRRFVAAGGLLGLDGEPSIEGKLSAEQKKAIEWVNWGRESNNWSRGNNSVKYAERMGEMNLDFSKVDSGDLILPVANGVIKFGTESSEFEFLSDSSSFKSLYVTKSTHTPYVPWEIQRTARGMARQGVGSSGAGESGVVAGFNADELYANWAVFDEFLETFLRKPLEEDSFRRVWKLLGSALLGFSIKKAIFLYGVRDTGKSTFMRMMDAALGDFSCWASTDIFKDGHFKNALAQVLPQRAVFISEAGDKVMDAGLFKGVTGGDEISCELKGINQPLVMKAKCTLIFGCNDAPDMKNVDDAAAERIETVPFRHQVTNKEQDPSKAERLPEVCRIPMLAWLVEGCRLYLSEGLGGMPDELQMEKRQFATDMNNMLRFAQEVLVQMPPEEFAQHYQKTTRVEDHCNFPLGKFEHEMCVGGKDLYDAWCQWAKGQGIEIGNNVAFTRAFKKAGFIQDGSKTTNGGQYRWLGLTFAPNFKRVKTAGTQGDSAD